MRSRCRFEKGDEMNATAEQTEEYDLVNFTVGLFPAESTRRQIAIADLNERYAPIVANAAELVQSKEGYEQVRVAIGELRTTRTGIEKRRKELNDDALAWKRRVDAEAKILTEAIVSIEEPLKAFKQSVDDEKERIKREKADAERRRAEEEAHRQREIQEAAIRKQREEEQERLRLENERLTQERAALMEERKRLAEERAKEDEARRLRDEQLAAERRKLIEEQQAIANEKARLEREEAERQARIRAEKEAVEKAERDRLEAEQAAIAAEKLKPDREKLKAFAASIRALTPPEVQFAESAEVLENAVADLGVIASLLENWQ